MSNLGNVEKEKEVQGQLNMLDDAIDRLETTVNSLTNSLSQVCKPTTEVPFKEEGSPSLVPVALKIFNLERRISNQVRSISDIIDLLEV